MSTTAIKAKDQRRQRTRAKVIGTAERPRLNVYISNRHITAQLIDDAAGVTLVGVATVNEKTLKGTLTERAEWVGTEIATLALKKKISKVVFDRGYRIYHGRLHTLAEAARKKGLEF